MADDGLDALLLVESVPEFGDDEEVLALHKTLIDGALDTDASLLLIAVIYDTSLLANNSFVERARQKRTKSTIEQPISGLDGLVDHVGGVVSDLPEAETVKITRSVMLGTNKRPQQ